MDIKQIQELVKLVNKSNIGELKIEQDDFSCAVDSASGVDVNIGGSMPGWEAEKGCCC